MALKELESVTSSGETADQAGPGKNILTFIDLAPGSLVRVEKTSRGMIVVRRVPNTITGKRGLGRKLWRFNQHGEWVCENPRDLCQPIINMLATGSHYFSVCDQYLRGFSGLDYSRMFGEFDGQYFPKNQGRNVWVRLENGLTWPLNWIYGQQFCSDRLTSVFGQGYSRLSNESSALQLHGEAIVFVPIRDKVELMLVSLTNTGDRVRTFDIIPTIPIFGGSRAYTEYHRDVVRLYNKSRIKHYLEIHPGLEWVEGHTEKSDVRYFMAVDSESGAKGDRIYTDRERFLGPRGWDEPIAIKADIPSAKQCLGKEAVGAIEYRKVALKPGESFKFVVVTGIADNAAQRSVLIKKYSYQRALPALSRVKKFWKRHSSAVKIKTLDPDFDFSWNGWWAQQLMIRCWFGNTGHPQYDYGSDFSGWREIWQDMMGALLVNPSAGREHLLASLEGIRLDGTNATRFFARTKKFGTDETRGIWCDHPYWTTPTVVLFIDYQGAPELLLVNGLRYFRDIYLSRGERKDTQWKPGSTGWLMTRSGRPATGTVLEHLLVQVLTMFYDVGKTGLILQKRADWNDGLDQVWGGTNTTFSMGLVKNLNDLADRLEVLKKSRKINTVQLAEELKILLEKQGRGKLNPNKQRARLKTYLKKVDTRVSGKRVGVKIKDLVEDLRSKAEAMKRTINRVAWNGGYYIGYFYADGKPVDSIFSKRRADRLIMLLPQAYALICDICEGERQSRVINSLWEYLWDKDNGGLKLNWPAFRQFDPKIGRLTGFAPGTKENNAIFSHANLFTIYGLLRQKLGAEAGRIWHGLNPLGKDQTITLTNGPWFPEYYISNDNENDSGKAEYPLLTASPGWIRFIFHQYFFGIRGTIDGLLLDPCLPPGPQFSRCSIEFDFRGARYRVNYHNPLQKANAKIKRLRVDGKEVKGNIIKPFQKGTHNIELELG